HIDSGLDKDELTFIENAIRLWNGAPDMVAGINGPTFECKRLKSVGASNPDFIQCFGDACGGLAHVDCTSPLDYCSTEGDEGIAIRPLPGDSCTACGPGQDCKCIFGE